MDITNNVYESLMHYFEVLKHVGYKSYSEVYSLIVYIFIEEMLTGDMSYFITEKDYNIIDRALHCLYGTCLIPYPSYKSTINEVRGSLKGQRVSQDDIIRTTTESNLRLESK